MDQDEKKINAAKASLDFIRDGTTLGIGTGSTVNHLIELLPDIRNRIEAMVSSSMATTERLEKLGFEVSMLNAVGDVDVYIDGADEATKHLQLIKGGGGALTREKYWRAHPENLFVSSITQNRSACSGLFHYRSRSFRWPNPLSQEKWSRCAANRSGGKIL